MKGRKPIRARVRSEKKKLNNLYNWTLNMRSKSIPFSSFYFTLFILVWMSGCSFVKLQDDLDEMNSHRILKGRVETDTATSSPIIVGLISVQKMSFKVVDSRVIEKKNYFEFPLPPGPGDFRLYAFEDTNKNMQHDPAERIGLSETIHCQDQVNTFETVIYIPAIEDSAIKEDVELLKRDSVNAPQFTCVIPGTKVDLEAEIFSQTNVTKGLWEPYNFIRTVPFGLFFLEEYKPTKSPVLFVHGVTGSPAQFRYFIENLDRTKYQPWVYYYPSGFPISVIGRHLYDELMWAKARYNFQTLDIIAHSMGGLVCKHFLNIVSSTIKAEDESFEDEYVAKDLGAVAHSLNWQHDDSIEDVKVSINTEQIKVNNFVSISTPWAGHGAATAGLKYAPVVIPVWKDVSPDSQFISDLFSNTIQDVASYYLLFGYKGSSIFTDGNSDGVVSIDSELRKEAQENAKIIRGYNEDHKSILMNSDVSSFLSSILSKSVSE